MSNIRSGRTHLWTGLVLALLAAPQAFAQLTVYSSGSVAVGTTRALTAYVPLSPATITWTVNGVAGGNSTYGTLVVTGAFTATYTAPATVPAANAVTVTATSTAFPAKFASATMTVTQPVPQLWSIAPTSTPVGPYSISLNGANYGANSVVKVGGVTALSVVNSATGITATGTATAAQVGTKLPVTVTNTGTGAVTTAAVQLSVTAAPPITVSVAPAAANVPATTTKQFSAAVSGTNNTAVTWTVNGVAGGNSTVGTISNGGLYTAPAAVPSPATVTIQAISAANAASAGTATVTVQPPPPPPVLVSVAPTPISVAPAGAQQFTATVTNNANTSVTWGVNGVAGGNSAIGTISAAGLYTAPATIPSPATVTVQATSVANPASIGSANVTIVGPPNPGSGLGTPNLSTARFLEQATFGPTAADIAHLQQIGINAWLAEQFAIPETPIVDPGSSGVLQQQYLNMLSAAPDQLRQRVAFALSKLIVISMNKNIYSNEVAPYLEIINHDAFGNYRTLLGDITVSSQMGMYLDLANSVKPSGASNANENYAREVMQLFTIGLVQLNMDGSSQLDGQGNPIPTYTQPTIHQNALALTGWTYPGAGTMNWQDFSGPMQPEDVNHDMTQKSMLGCTLPAGQTTVQDTNALLDCLFNHPNVPPFIATRLIRAMVTSNPSPGYIQRVATVFANDGFGVRGNMKAVITAILTDAEARNDAAPPNSGRLKDSIQQIVGFARALNGQINASNGLPWEFSLEAETPLTAPSVFSFYSPLYHVPKSPLFGPEFQIYTPTEAVERGNFLWGIISNPSTDFTVSLAPYNAAVGNLKNLIDAVDQTLLYGRMPQAMRQSLANAIVAQSSTLSQVQTALYLTTLSGFYAVQF